MTRLTRRRVLAVLGRFAYFAIPPLRSIGSVAGAPALFANFIGITSESDFSSPYIIGYLHVQVSNRQSQLADDRVLRTRVFYANAFCSLPPWMRC